MKRSLTMEMTTDTESVSCRSMMESVRHLLREGGIGRFYRGIQAYLLLMVPRRA